LTNLFLYDIINIIQIQEKNMNFEAKKKMLEDVSELIRSFPETLQEKAFDFLIADIPVSPTTKQNSSADIDENEINSDGNIPVKARKQPSTKKMVGKAQPQIDKGLNLRPTDKTTLSDFFNEKLPSGNIQTTAVMVYYLQEILKLQEITSSQILTCYREPSLSLKIPGNLEQNLRDCSSSQYGYIDFTKGKCTMSVQGINFVEHDLPKKAKK
jgi:hypothetical protein